MTNDLRTEAERFASIINNTNDKFYFEHQDLSDIPSFQNGAAIYENRFGVFDLEGTGQITYINLQDNVMAGQFIRDNETAINNAATEFGVSADLVKAVIYTEQSRGWYDSLILGFNNTFRPGNLDPKWEALIPGSSVHNVGDNIRLTAALLSRIEARLEDPNAEDVYALYNGLGHDRTYQNQELKSTPYYMKMVMEDKAWEYGEWHLGDQNNTLNLDIDYQNGTASVNAFGRDFNVVSGSPFTSFLQAAGYVDDNGRPDTQRFIDGNPNNNYLTDRLFFGDRGTLFLSTKGDRISLGDSYGYAPSNYYVSNQGELVIGTNGNFSLAQNFQNWWQNDSLYARGTDLTQLSTSTAYALLTGEGGNVYQRALFMDGFSTAYRGQSIRESYLSGNNYDGLVNLDGNDNGNGPSVLFGEGVIFADTKDGDTLGGYYSYDREYSKGFGFAVSKQGFGMGSFSGNAAFGSYKGGVLSNAAPGFHPVDMVDINGNIVFSGQNMLTDAQLNSIVTGQSLNFDRLRQDTGIDYFHPVAIDLGTNGLELVNLNDSPVFFDMDNDGYQENTGWVAATDGMLVIDLGGDGKIDQALELSFKLWDEDALTDIDGLKRVFDTNDDNVFNASDERFSEFRIWQDVNQNGIVEDGELKTLAQWGITAIDLHSELPQEGDIPDRNNGNFVFDDVAITWNNGHTGRAYDVALAYGMNGSMKIAANDNMKFVSISA